jgi:hypothetical protein
MKNATTTLLVHHPLFKFKKNRAKITLYVQHVKQNFH